MKSKDWMVNILVKTMKSGFSYDNNNHPYMEKVRVTFTCASQEQFKSLNINLKTIET